jgi:serine/threonine protein kinase
LEFLREAAVQGVEGSAGHAVASAGPAIPAPDVAGLLDGTPYRALHVLGAGGMGVVVAAEHVALGKPVVIKLLHVRYARDAHLADRLRVEAQRSRYAGCSTGTSWPNRRRSLKGSRSSSDVHRDALPSWKRVEFAA